MRSQAFQSFFLSLLLVNTGLCFPGHHYHIPRRVTGNLEPSSINAEPVITPGPELRKAFERRAVQAAQAVTLSCDESGSSCAAYDYSLSLITTFNPQQLTATDGNWCLGPGCVSASRLPLVTPSGTGDNAQSTFNTSSTSAFFGNGTDTTFTPGPTGSGSISPSTTSGTQGPTAVGTGDPSNGSVTESAPFGNNTGTTSFIIGSPQRGPTAGTGIFPVNTFSETGSRSNITGSPTFSSGPTGFGTGTASISANPLVTDTSRGPFANSTGTSGPQVGPTGIGLPGTGVDPEGTSTTVLTSETTISVTTYSDDQWASWSIATAQAADTATTTCTDEEEPSNPATKAAAAETSFKSTATLGFAETTYTIPIPASFTSDVPSPDTNEAEASSFADAASASPASSPLVTAYPDSSKSSSQPYYPDSNSPSPASDTTFDAVSWSTESCSTSTFFDVVTVPKFTLIPTASASICYGIKCNAVSSCQDWMSVYPFTDANGYPITTTSRRAPYANATNSEAYQGQGTGTRGGGFYPVQTGTGAVASSQFTGNPWPSSPNATRNPTAYTNTAEITGSVTSANFSVTPTDTVSAANSSATAVDAVRVTTLYNTISGNDGAELSAYTTSTFDPQQPTNTFTVESAASVQPFETNNAAALHPWVAWTVTLESSATNAVTNDPASASATSGSYGTDDQSDDGSGIHMLHNNLALDSKHKRAAVKAGRKSRKRERTEERQEKKYDGLLQKKRGEWEVEGHVAARDERVSCCRGMSIYCWLVGSKAEGDC